MLLPSRSRFSSRSSLPALAALGVLVLGATRCSSPPADGDPTAAVAPAPAGAVTLPGNLHPRARSAVDAGRMSAAHELRSMSILLQMTPAQKERSRAALADLEDPVSPRYHAWWTPAAYAEAFGARGEDVARVRAWAESEGFVVHGLGPLGNRLVVSATVGQVEHALHAEMHLYDVAGERHFALASEPSIPRDLAPLILGIHGLHDFGLPASTKRPRSGHDADFTLPNGDAGSGGTLTLSPADYATIFDLEPLYRAGITGKGQDIAVVGMSEFHDDDLLAFRAAFGLPAGALPVRELVPGSGAPRVDRASFGEGELDLEWAGAVAPEATLHYVYTGDNPAYSVWDAIIHSIEKGYPVITSSYGGCELFFQPSERIFLETMGDAASMVGSTLVNASGDHGAAGCDAFADPSETGAVYGKTVVWPASIPSVVAVGGTELDWGDPVPAPPVTAAWAESSPFSTYWACRDGGARCAAKGYVPETGWNEIDWEITNDHDFWGASGGGESVLFPKPSWQVGQTAPGAGRQLPDVAMPAAYAQVGYVVSKSWSESDGQGGAPHPQALSRTGGTSAAAPSFAGILALVNDAIARRHPRAPSGLGNANPMLYALAAATKGTASPAFHDVTTGSNVVPCAPASPDCPAAAPYELGYRATPGHDMVTGLGSVDGARLVAAWSELTPTSTRLSVRASSRREGAPVTLTATVSSRTGAAPMTGDVVFYLETTRDGLPDLTAMETAHLVPTKRGLARGVAEASVVVPPGLHDRAHVAAFYGGDRRYLASWSPRSTVAAASCFAVAPASLTLRPNAQATVSTAGGLGASEWFLATDTTCDAAGACADVAPVSATEAVVQAGGSEGTALVRVFDANHAEALVSVTVAGAPVERAPLPPAWQGGGAAR